MARLSRDDLASTSRQIEVCDLHGRAQGRFLVHDLLRRLAGRREVFGGTLERRQAVLKRYAGRGSHGACAREAGKLEYLVSHGLPVPRVLVHGADTTGQPLLVLSHCPGRLGSRVMTRSAPPAERDAALAVFLDLFCRLLHSDARQRDPHLDNHLWDGPRLWMVDAASVAIGPVDKRLATNELARQLAVFDLPTGERATELTQHCVDLQSGRSAVHLHRLQRLIETERRRRTRRLARKTKRLWSSLEALRAGANRGCCLATLPAAIRHSLVDEPERLLGQGRPLKVGRSAQLAMVEEGALRYVLKRFVPVRPGLLAGDSIGTSRARRAWQAGWLLTWLGVPTPQPLALWETRRGALAGPSWLLLKASPGHSLDQVYGTLHSRGWQDAVTGCRRLAQELAAWGVVHGDLKLANFLRQPDGAIQVLDLDAVRTPRLAIDRRCRLDTRRLERSVAETTAPPTHPTSS